MTESPGAARWYSVRAVLWDEKNSSFEERITLWSRGSFESAMAAAQEETAEYAELLGLVVCDLQQAFSLDDELAEITDGTELFSLMRHSPLAPGDYVDRFFATGTENGTSP